jgi:hypothetical protein
MDYGNNDTYPNLPEPLELHLESESRETREVLFTVLRNMTRQWAVLAAQVKP